MENMGAYRDEVQEGKVQVMLCPRIIGIGYCYSQHRRAMGAGAPVFHGRCGHIVHRFHGRFALNVIHHLYPISY